MWGGRVLFLHKVDDECQNKGARHQSRHNLRGGSGSAHTPCSSAAQQAACSSSWRSGAVAGDEFAHVEHVGRKKALYGVYEARGRLHVWRRGVSKPA